MSGILQRFPNRSAILPVYAVLMASIFGGDTVPSTWAPVDRSTIDDNIFLAQGRIAGHAKQREQVF